MMKRLLSLSSLAVFASIGFASGQGLLNIGKGTADEDFESRLPFTTTIGVDFGYDDNARSAPDGFEEESSYVRGGISAKYGGGSRRTKVTLNAGFSTIYYFDQAAGQSDDTFYSARAGVNIRHKVNPRLTVGNNFYLSYEVEPDNVIGSSASRRLDQYLYGYNSLWASYSWTRRFSTITRYTFTGIEYEESDVATGEDRLTHMFSQEMRYVLTALTTSVAEYRYKITDYDQVAGRDYNSHYFLLGLDHQFSRDLRGTVRVGAEIRDSDTRGESTRPYAETSLRYALAKRTSLHWYGRIGLEDSELGFSTFDQRYTYRTALTLSQSLTERLRGHTGITYIHSDFEGGPTGDLDEDLISLNVGLSYRVFSNVDLNASYYFTDVSSGRTGRDFQRNRFSAGFSVTF